MRLPALALATVLGAGVLLVPAASPANGMTGSHAAPRAHPQQQRSAAPRRIPFGTVLTATADGSVWGAGQTTVRDSSRTRLTLLHRSPRGAWSTRPIGIESPVGNGVRPLAVADDGRTTFVVYTMYLESDAREELRLVKVPHGGRPSASRVLDTGERKPPFTLGAFSQASVIARAGRWWAVWTTNDAALVSGMEVDCEMVRQARTISPAIAPRPVSRLDVRLVVKEDGEVPTCVGGGRHVGMAWRGNTALLASKADERHESPAQLAVRLRQGDETGEFEYPGVILPNAMHPALGASGARMFVSYVDPSSGRLGLAQDNGNLRFSRRLLPSRARPSGTAVAASGGRVFVAYSAEFVTSPPARQTQRVYLAVAGLTGPFRTRELSAPFGARDRGVRAGLNGLTAARGRATASFWVSGAGDYAARLP